MSGKHIALNIEMPPGYSVIQRVTKNGSRVFSFVPPDTQPRGAYSAEWAAEDAAERHYRKSLRKERECIGCEEKFLSEGAHHRMCWRCRGETYGVA